MNPLPVLSLPDALDTRRSWSKANDDISKLLKGGRTGDNHELNIDDNNDTETSLKKLSHTLKTPPEHVKDARSRNIGTATAATAIAEAAVVDDETSKYQVYSLMGINHASNSQGKLT